MRIERVGCTFECVFTGVETYLGFSEVLLLGQLICILLSLFIACTYGDDEKAHRMIHPWKGHMPVTPVGWIREAIFGSDEPFLR